MTHLARNPRKAATLVQRKAGEGVAQVVRRDAHIGHVCAPHALTPDVPVQDTALVALDDELVIGAKSIVGKVGGKARQDCDRAWLPRLGWDDLSELCGLVDVDHAVANAAGRESAHFAWTQPGVRDQADDDLVSRRWHRVADCFDLERRERLDQFSMVRHAAHVPARVVVDDFVFFGGRQGGAEDAGRAVDGVVGSASCGHVGAVRLDASLCQLVDGDLAEHRIDPLVAQQGALVPSADAPLRRIVLEPLFKPVVQRRSGRCERGGDDLHGFALEASLDERVELDGVAVRGEALGALLAGFVAVRNAPRTRLGIGPAMDAHSCSLVVRCCQVVVRSFVASHLDATASASKRKGDNPMSPVLMRDEEAAEDCYDASYRGRSSVGRATASQYRPNGSQCCQAIPPIPLKKAGESVSQTDSASSLRSLVSVRCCQVCCQPVRNVSTDSAENCRSKNALKPDNKADNIWLAVAS